MPRKSTVVSAVCLALGLAGGGWAPARAADPAPPTGREIMERVTTTRKLDGSEATVKMTVIDDTGQKRERQLTMATKLYDGGKTEKRVYRFVAPADVQGTGVLVFDYQGKADDVWIYLPALRKTRRIVSAQRTQSFMGSEFTYGDLNIPALDDFTYVVAKDDTFAGEPCWVVDVLPRNQEIAAGEGYSKKTFWVSKEKAAVLRGLYFDKSGTLLKELLAQKVTLLDAKQRRYRPLRMEMVNKQNGRRSVFESTRLLFAPATKDDYFSTAYLERN